MRVIRSRAGLLSIAFCAAAVTACGSDPAADARRFIASGDRYAAAGRLKEAAIEYRNAIERQPSAPEVRHELAKVYDRLGQPDKAIESLAAAVARGDVHTDARMRVARVMLASGQSAPAQRVLEDVVRAEPRNTDALVMLAQALEAQGRAAAAGHRLDDALRVTPDSPSLYVARGLWEFRRDRLQDAERTLQKAATLDPRAAEPWEALGAVYAKAGDVRQAEAALLKALDLSRDKTAVHRLLASFYAGTGQRDRVEQHLVAAAESSPRDRLALADYYINAARFDRATPLLSALADDKTLGGEALLRLASIDARRQRWNEAMTAIDRAVARKDVEARARLLKSELLADRGDTTQALAEAGRAAKLQPGSPDITYATAIIHFRRGEIADAARLMEQVASEAPKSAAAFTALGMIQDQAHDRVAAQRAYEQALALDYNAGIAANNLAWLDIDAGKLDEAQRLAQQAVHALHEAAPVLDTLGWVYHVQGNDAAAIALLRRARDAAPNSPVYRAHLGLALEHAGDHVRARQQLVRALSLSHTFAGAEAASRALQRLQQ